MKTFLLSPVQRVVFAGVEIVFDARLVAALISRLSGRRDGRLYSWPFNEDRRNRNAS